MSAPAVISLGIGSPASIEWLITLGLGEGAAVTPPAATTGGSGRKFPDQMARMLAEDWQRRVRPGYTFYGTAAPVVRGPRSDQMSRRLSLDWEQNVGDF